MTRSGGSRCGPMRTEVYQKEDEYILVLAEDMCVYFGGFYADEGGPYQGMDIADAMAYMAGDYKALVYDRVWGKPIYVSES